ncbi:MAG: hypothetical protein VB080_01880 [Propionicimonas sp.]|uniref:hypothetical protein n=1 Tax=Propionicimonas sp. TaxID=1955623 RepID=UPI002B1EEBF2|nr:hypothetical protein [Propionicimonas sp.]MEA4943165.1 hypothetical protein [Propionicimonas sp.]MEA5052043.1 hypothetical protein [Propionicimonas sp.]MEA5118307.1 hypothetical protein [Propionicimonas sp.]
MPKRPSKHTQPPRPLHSGSFATLVEKADGEWLVQSMPAGNATKPYTCPGCGLTVPVGQAHLVSWPRQASIGSPSAVEERRHWHTSCWNRRH